MSSLIIYTKDDDEISVSTKFVYHCSVMRIWKRGVCLISDNYYTTTTPLDIKKVPTILKKKGYSIHRFIELESAPEEYLISKGYKLKKL